MEEKKVLALEIVNAVEKRGSICIPQDREGLEWDNFEEILRKKEVKWTKVAEEVVPNYILFYRGYYSTDTVNKLIKINRDRLKKIYPDLFEEENKKETKKEKRSVFALDEEER